VESGSLFYKDGQHKEVTVMRYVILLCAVVSFTAAACFADSGMTCGSTIVSVGDSKPSIMEKCGPPWMIEQLSASGTRAVWIYNFGSSGFMKKLSFDGETLESIEDGEKGFDK